MSVAGDSRSAAAGEMTNATPGTRFGRAREAQNLTAADVARRLKLSVWQIEALESGRYDQLPGPIFVRGFIRNYARLLKLDPEDFLDEAADNLPHAASWPEAPPSPDIPFPKSTSWGWQKYASGAAVIVALLAVYEFYWSEPEQEEEPPVAEVSSPPAPPAPQQAASAQSAPPAATSAVAAPAERELSSAASAAQNSVTPAASGERELRFVFDEESWVEIRDRSDKTIFAQLNRAGSAQRVTGMAPLSIVVGNAQGVKMTYAGKPVDLARHTKYDVARLRLE
jgi:cytoskeleton protein RodZ